MTARWSVDADRFGKTRTQAIAAADPMASISTPGQPHRIARESPEMTNAESTTDPALLIRNGTASQVVEPSRGVVTIGRDPHAIVRIDDPRISRTHRVAEYADGLRRVIDNSMHGMFVDGLRKSAVTVTDGVTIHLGDPVTGPSAGFPVVPSG